MGGGDGRVMGTLAHHQVAVWGKGSRGICLSRVSYNALEATPCSGPEQPSQHVCGRQAVGKAASRTVRTGAQQKAHCCHPQAIPEI